MSSSSWSQLGITSSAEAAYLVSVNQTDTLINLAATVVLLYDTILAAPVEIHCIWQRKWSGVTFLYAFIRYSTLLATAWRFLSDVYVPPQANALYLTGNILILFSVTSVAVFDCLRVWAISDRNWKPAVVVFLLSMVPPAIDIYADALPSSFIVTHGDAGSTGCWYTGEVPSYPYCRYPSLQPREFIRLALCLCQILVGVFSRLAAVLADIMILGVTLHKTWGLYRRTQELSIRTEIYSLLVTTGIIQFLMLLALNIVSMVFDVLSITTVTTKVSQALVLAEVLSAIIICRFLLDLRTIYPDNSSTFTGEPMTAQSSVRFANSVVGNIGAPLRTNDLSWSSIAEDTEPSGPGDDRPIYSDEPFEATLLQQEGMRGQ
ncbi:hypothetical protein K474DRAFT_1767614 [Panus rudis PR-1116 ss-1]|nr:hypothetical protein K474DRAFT_1767614 [Panus rudis PR-1116 ss-1]